MQLTLSTRPTAEDSTAGALAGRRRPAPLLLAAIGCLALAVLSERAFPSVPIYDEYSWLVWGREIADGLTGAGAHGPLSLGGGPSWKPFPVLVTTLFAFTGGAAVTLWMVWVRAIGLLGLLLAHRLASRLGRSPDWRLAGPVAGVLAAAAVALTENWFHPMFRGTSEPLTITAALLWAELALAGRRGWACAAGVVLAGMRPESGVLLAAYGAWCIRREPGLRARIAIGAGILLVPLAWLVPPWLAGGAADQASARAREFHGNDGHDVVTLVLTRAAHVDIAPVLVLAAGLAVVAVVRRERPLLLLTGAALLYVAVVEAMAIAGFPGLPRFFLPAAALVCILAAVAVARIGSLARGGARSALLMLVVVALAAPFALAPLRAAPAERRLAAIAQRDAHLLSTAARRAGGASRALPCARSVASVDWRVAPNLAWILDVPLLRVRPLTGPTWARGPSLAFIAPAGPVTGQPPAPGGPGRSEHPIARNPVWRTERVLQRGDPAADHCVGS